MFNIFAKAKTIANQGEEIISLNKKLKNEQLKQNELCEENENLYAENKELRYENEELQFKIQQYENTLNQIRSELLQTNNYNNIVNYQNKLKSMLDRVSGKHF